MNEKEEKTRKVKVLKVSVEIRYDTIPAPSDAGMQNTRDVVMTRLLALAEQGLWGPQSNTRILHNVDIPHWTADQIRVDVDEVALHH